MSAHKYSAEYWVKKLNLIAHPEGGFFREVNRSDESIAEDALPSRYGGSRCFSTSIYFLLRAEDFSAFHRLLSDETWHFYAGDPLDLFMIDKKGKMDSVKIGNDPEAGEELQFTITRGKWFAARTRAGGSYSLIGCTVAPGFDFNDFELGKRSELINQYPAHRQLIEEFTRS